MPARTRSPNSLDSAGEFDVRAEITQIRHEMADPRVKRLEMGEIKGLLSSICASMSSQGPEFGGTAGASTSGIARGAAGLAASAAATVSNTATVAGSSSVPPGFSPQPNTAGVQTGAGAMPLTSGAQVNPVNAGSMTSTVTIPSFLPRNTQGAMTSVGNVNFQIEPNTVNPSFGPVFTTATRTHVLPEGRNFNFPERESQEDVGMNHYGIDTNQPWRYPTRQPGGTAVGIGAGMPNPGGGMYWQEPPRYLHGVIPNPYTEMSLRSQRLELTLFNGEDAVGWLQQCEKFFEMTGTPVDQWVNLASGHLVGRAGKWFRNLAIPWYCLNWQQFYLMVLDRFTEANAHEAVELLQNAKQTGSVMQYIDKFEDCVSLVKRDHPYLTESYILSCFIGGLRADIKHDVCGQKPQNLLAGYWYAKVYEKASIAKRLSYQSGFNRNKPQFQPAQSSGTRFVNQKNTTQGVEKEKKTCWYCKEPWNYQHKYKVGKVVHMMEEVKEE